MSRACLALNASMEPLKMMSLKRAIRLVLQGKAEVVEVDEGRALRSATSEIPRPLVIRLTKFIKVPRRFRRQVTNTFLFARDNYTCQYCGRHQSKLKAREFLNRDHIHPQSQGGENSWTNCVTACSSCNTRKENKTPKEAGMKLLSTPSEPHLVHLLWTVRNLTPQQEKYIRLFYGDEVFKALK